MVRKSRPMNLVVFDIDGTLIRYHRKKNDQAYVRAMRETLGITIGDSWSAYTHSTDSGILTEIIEKHQNRPCGEEDIKAFQKSMGSWLHHEYGTEPFEGTSGAEECLKALSNDSNWVGAIATGNWEFAANYKLRSAGLHFPDVPLASADDGLSRESILETALSKAKQAHRMSEFNKVVYVGDWIWDVKAANALGWGFIGIGSGEVEQTLRESGAKQVLPDFSGFLPALKNLD